MLIRIQGAQFVHVGRSRHSRHLVWQDLPLGQAAGHLLLQQLHLPAAYVQHGHALLAWPNLQVRC